eukprot:1462377-Prymnesium_polylepis.1
MMRHEYFSEGAEVHALGERDGPAGHRAARAVRSDTTREWWLVRCAWGRRVTKKYGNTASLAVASLELDALLSQAAVTLPQRELAPRPFAAR